MERDESPPPQLEEEVADDMSSAEMKSCSVLLDRIRPEEESAKKELEEKDDLSRKSGKTPVSRIPTFQSTSTKKRATGSSQSTELPLPKKDALSHAVSPPEKVSSGSVDVSKSKLPGIRETALPLPTTRLPKLGFEAPYSLSSTEQPAVPVHSSLASTPKSSSWTEGSEFVEHHLLAVSPRPALRTGQQEEQSSENEVHITQDSPISHLSHEDFLSQTSLKHTVEKWRVEVESRSGLSDTGDAGRSESEEAGHEDEEKLSLVKSILDEEPPWETEPVQSHLALEEDDGSDIASDAQYADDVAVEKSDSGSVCESEGVKVHHQEFQEKASAPTQSSSPPEKSTDIDKSTSPAGANRRPKAKSSQSAKGSACASFALFCLLPTTLLLIGGFGQHVWHYGLPMSVAHLMAQLELHWLEGFGLIPEPCSSDCRVRLVETIPVGLYESDPPSLPSISDSWLSLLGEANSSVHIAAFYFTLRATDLELTEPTDSQGRKVFDQLMQLESKGVKLQIAVNAPQTSTQDTENLAATGAEIREIDLQAVTGGIIHTKLWVVDQKHFYVGSANMDWRSLSQVKEVGLAIEDCSCLAQDAARIFGVYWDIGGRKNGSLPPYWPARLSALSSSQHPLRLKFNGVPAHVYLSSAPPQISARGRTDDLSSILSVIEDAQKFIYISVMDYLPLSQFIEPPRFWPAIDSALRSAACTRGVEVRLLVSCWQHSPASMFIFLQSLLVLNRPPLACDISVNVFVVPSTSAQSKIPFARVNHAKYMVTDRVVYIGTSNWSENYFTQTAGVGLVVNQTGTVVGSGQVTLQSQVEELFLRDWNSQYARTLSDSDVDVCSRHHH
ncbi:phospholipase D3 isoform X2 [Myripristis murdjan]|uniref:Phospholipase D family, member 7 n=2 Tax=Myripristis murdjan TaxID=586833 RepID=A0A667YPK8_9TELE|nr:phospholipase D3-like isoform X2 [Myripristis murdjan]